MPGILVFRGRKVGDCRYHDDFMAFPGMVRSAIILLDLILTNL